MKIDWKKIGMFVLKVAMIVLLILVFEGWALIGILGYYIIRSVVVCFLARDKIILIKHSIETTIWGKPLKYFKPGELKNTKVRIKWRKKKDDPKKNKRRTRKSSKHK